MSLTAMIPQREVLNQMQIQTLLGAVQALTMSLGHLSQTEEENIPRSSRIDGGVKLKAEQTLCNIYFRLDQILEDDARWETDSLKSVEERLGALYEAQRELSAQRKAYENTPHYKYKPVLMRLGEGWLAICGDPAFLDKAMCGYGETPELALKCFDMIFDGSAPEELVRWLTTQNQHETNQVDGQGDSNTQGIEGGGEISSGDSGLPGA
jgi:hypothetical protein